MRVPRHSLEYVFVDVTASPTAAADLDHEIAIVAEGTQPGASDWKTATWDATETAAKLLVRMSTDADTGGSVTLSVGRWDVWWRTDSTPEYPARKAGVLTVT